MLSPRPCSSPSTPPPSTGAHPLKVFFVIAGLTALGLFGSFFLVFSDKPQRAAKGGRTERQPLLLND